MEILKLWSRMECNSHGIESQEKYRSGFLYASREAVDLAIPGIEWTGELDGKLIKGGAIYRLYLTPTHVIEASDYQDKI